MTAEASLPADAEAALIAALLVTAGAGVSGRLVPVLGVPLVTAGFVTGWIAARRSSVRDPAPRSFRWIYFWITVNATVALSVSPGYTSPAWYEAMHMALPIAGIIFVGIVASGTPRLGSMAALTAVAGVSVLTLATPIAIPHPDIDVWALTQTSAHNLLRGVQPYTIVLPDAYGGRYDFGYRPTVYPYMPLTLLIGAPAVTLFGDYRYALALAFPLSILWFRAAGRRLGVERHTIDVVTLALALRPSAAFVVAAGWVEPVMLAMLSLFLLASARRPNGPAATTAFFLIAALKQYFVAPILILLGMKPKARSVAIAAAVAASTIAPFLLWHPRATLDGIMAIPMQMRAPAAFRSDAISLTAVAALVFGVRAGAALGAAAQIVAGAVAFVMLRNQGLGGLLLASALSLLAAFLLGTQAFVNYYAFTASLLAGASLAFAARDRRTP